MVSTNDALESKYLTAEFVKNSKTKVIEIIASGSYDDVTFDGETSRRLTVPVEIDGKQKLWRPNRDSVSNMDSAFSPINHDTNDWISHKAKVGTIKMQGKDCIVVSPLV